MNAPTQLLPDHHKHCDDLFVAAENAAACADWAAATAAFARFRAQMEAHFAVEEKLLFPGFEAATGMSDGPTRMMRLEHEQMRTLLDQLAQSCAARDGDGYAGIAETLLMLLQQHNMKEENILYPMCDQALGPRAEQIGVEMRAFLEHAGA